MWLILRGNQCIEGRRASYSMHISSFIVLLLQPTKMLHCAQNIWACHISILYICIKGKNNQMCSTEKKKRKNTFSFPELYAQQHEARALPQEPTIWLLHVIPSKEHIQCISENKSRLKWAPYSYRDDDLPPVGLLNRPILSYHLHFSSTWQNVPRIFSIIFHGNWVQVCIIFMYLEGNTFSESNCTQSE